MWEGCFGVIELPVAEAVLRRTGSQKALNVKLRSQDSTFAKVMRLLLFSGFQITLR